MACLIGQSTPKASPHAVLRPIEYIIKPCLYLHVLTEPANTLAVTLTQYHRAHEDFYWPDAFQRYLSLAGGLVQA